MNMKNAESTTENLRARSCKATRPRFGRKRRVGSSRGSHRRRIVKSSCLFVALAVALAVASVVEANTMPEDLTRHNILHYLRDNQVTTVEEFIIALPPLHKRHFAMVFESKALAKDFVSGAYPRVISYGADARFVFSWGTDPASPFRKSVEFLRPVKNKWVAGVIEFGGETPVIREPKSCASCHGGLNKPLWGREPHFAGTEYDAIPEMRNTLTHAVYPAFSEIIDARVPDLLGNRPPQENDGATHQFTIDAMASSDPRLAPLDFGDPLPDTASFRRICLEGDDCLNFVEELSRAFLWRHGQVLFNIAKNDPDYEQTVRDMVCSDFMSRRTEWAPAGKLDSYFGEDQNLALLSGTTNYIQGGTFRENEIHLGFNGSIEASFLFLMYHDLWKRDAYMAEAYRDASGYEDPLVPRLDMIKAGIYTGHFSSMSSTTLEDELLYTHGLYFGKRGQAAIDARKAHTSFSSRLGRGHVYGFGGDIYISAHVRVYGHMLCKQLQETGVLQTLRADRTAAEDLAISGFTLVDSTTNEDILEIREGDEIVIDADVTNPMTIRAEVEGAVGSVHLALTESQFAVRTERTDNVAPYAVHADDGAGDYAGAVLPTGEYYVSATPYMAADRGGDAGPTYTMRFAITADDAAEESVITGFTLVYAASSGSGHQEIMQLTADTEVDLGTLSGQAFNVRADIASGETVGSVRLELTGPISNTRTENVSPYFLYGDRRSSGLAVGAYRLSATPYPEPRQGGQPGPARTVSFSVVEPPEEPGTPETSQSVITGFTLVYAASSGSGHQEIMQLTAGTEVDLGTLSGQAFNVRADIASGETVGSVRLELTGPISNTRTENVSPYFLYGDRRSSGLAVGAYRLSATPYPEPRQGGQPGPARTVSFSVVEPPEEPGTPGFTGEIIRRD